MQVLQPNVLELIEFRRTSWDADAQNVKSSGSCRRNNELFTPYSTHSPVEESIVYHSAAGWQAFRVNSC